MREKHGFRAADVSSVHAFVHDYVLTTTGNRWPTTGLEGKFSIFHVLAAALADGAALPAQFTDARTSDPALEELRSRVVVEHDRDQTKDSARVVVTLHDGTVESRSVAHNLGTPGAPMTDEQLEDKLIALAAPILGHQAATRLAACCWKVTELPDLRRLLDLTVPGTDEPLS